MEMSFVFVIKLITLFYICTANARRIVRKNDEKQSYVVNYQHGDRIIPITVELDPALETEYVMNLSPEPENRSVSFYDFRKGLVAFKILDANRCFIARLELETMQNDQKTLVELKNQVISDSMSLSEFQVHHEITPSYLRSISGRKMSRFCDGFELYVLEELSERGRSARSKRNVPTSNRGSGHFTHRSYSHNGNQGTTYVHHSQSYISGQLGENGPREVKTHEIQVRSEGVQPIATQNYNQQFRPSNFPSGTGLGPNHNNAFVQNQHWSSSSSSEGSNVKDRISQAAGHANGETKQHSNRPLDLGVRSEFRSETEKSEHYTSNQNNGESGISGATIPSSSLYKSSLRCCQHKNVNVLSAAVGPEEQILGSSHQPDRILSQGIPVHPDAFMQPTIPPNHRLITSHPLNIMQPYPTGIPESRFSSGVSTQLGHQFKPDAQLRYPFHVGFQPGKNFQVGVRSGYPPQVGIQPGNHFQNNFQLGQIFPFGGQPIHSPPVGSQTRHHTQVDAQLRYPTQFTNQPGHIPQIAVQTEQRYKPQLSHPSQTDIQPRFASDVNTELKHSTAVDAQQEHSPQLASQSGHQTHAVFQSGYPLQSGVQQRHSAEVEVRPGHSPQVVAQPNQFSQTGILLTYPSDTGTHLGYPPEVRVQSRYPFHPGFQPRYSPQVNVQSGHLSQAASQPRYPVQGAVQQENFQVQVQNPHPPQIGILYPLQVEVQSENRPQTRMQPAPDSQTGILSKSQSEAQVNLEHPSNVRVQPEQSFQRRYSHQVAIQPGHLPQSTVELRHPSQAGSVTNYERTSAGTSSDNVYQGIISQIQIQSGSSSAHGQSGLISGSTQSQIRSDKQNIYPGSSISVDTSGASQSQAQFDHQSGMGTKGSFLGGMAQVQVHGGRISNGTGVRANGTSNRHVHVKITGVHKEGNNSFQTNVSGSTNSTGRTRIQFQSNYNSETPRSATAQNGLNVMKDFEKHTPVAGSALNIPPSVNVPSDNVPQPKFSREQTPEQSKLLNQPSLLHTPQNNQNTQSQSRFQLFPSETLTDSQTSFMAGRTVAPPTPSTMQNDISRKSPISQKISSDLLGISDSSPSIPLTSLAVPAQRPALTSVQSSKEPSENLIPSQIFPATSSHHEIAITAPRFSPHQGIQPPPFLPTFPQVPGQFVNIPAFSGSQFIPNFSTGFSGQAASQPRTFPIPPNPYGPQLPLIHVPYAPNNLNGQVVRSEISIQPSKNSQGIDLSDQIESRVTVFPFQPNYPQRADAVESVNANTFSQHLTFSQPGQQQSSFIQHFSETQEQSCCGVLPNFRQRCCDEKKRFGDKVLEPRCCTRNSFTNSNENQHTSGVTRSCKAVQTNCHIVYKSTGKARICKTATDNIC